MRHQQTATRLFLLFFCFAFAHIALASDKDSLLLLQQKSKGAAATTGNKAFDKHLAPVATRTFSGLDNYLSQELFSVKDGAGFDNTFFEQFNSAATDTSIAAWRLAAQMATQELEQTNSFVDYLLASDIHRLPVGFKKSTGTGAYVTIAVSSAIFQKDYAELTVFARLKIQQREEPLFFGIQGLKLSYTGGIIGSARLVLLGDVAIPINGNSTALILRGSGFSKATGTAIADDKTFITMDCKGIKEIGLSADLQFSRNVMIPVNSAGAPEATGNVTASIPHMVVTDWNDIIASISFNKPFQVKGLNGFVFNVKTAAFDFSDTRNNADIVYPPGYQDKYLQKDNLNTWRGVYVRELSVALPKAFKNRETPSDMVTFGVNDMLIDNNGLTGVFFANNVLPINKGNAAGWKFSVDSIRIALEANRLTRAGFGGRLGLPVNKTEATGKDTLNKKKFLEYGAAISVSGDYVCRVTTRDTLAFDVFAATVKLMPNSYVQLRGNDEKFEAEAMLNGKIGITSSIMKAGETAKGKTDIADMKGIDFQELHVTSYPPYFTAKYFGYKGELKFGNFPISFQNIALVKPSPNEVGIEFSVELNLGDEKGESSSFKGRTRLAVLGNIQNENGGILNWKFNRIRVDSVIIDANVKNAFKLDGWVAFFDNDDTDKRRPGRGFEGGINATFKGLDAKIAVRALFGKATTYRYWYVDGKVEFKPGLTAGPFTLNGFAGGAYYSMAKEGYGESLPEEGVTGINYKADSTAGLGVKAGILFNIVKTQAIRGQVSFEMAFNKGGGLRYIGLFGMVRISSDDLVGTGAGKSVGGFLTKQLKKVDSLQKVQGTSLDLKTMKETDPTKAAQKEKELSEQLAKEEDKDDPNLKPGVTGLAAYIGIQYDFNKKSLHATFDLYINVLGGFLQGIGEGNKAGWAVFHTEPGKWYLHAGTPTNPIGVKFGIGGFSIRTESYFMLGHDMPAFPPPPKIVLQILEESGLKYESNVGKNDVAGGRGIAFGASVQINTGDLTFGFFYASFAAGIGFDIMLKDMGENARCKGSDKKLGINGWYAQGQSYVYLQGDLGIKIKLAFIKKKISIIRGGAAALMQARLPNPTWVGGALGMHIEILGGLIKGRFAFKFSFGKDCEIVQDGPATEEEIKIIEQITPAENTEDVNVFSDVAVKFRVKPGVTLDLPKDDGSGSEYFRGNVDQIKLFKGDAEVAGKIIYNEEGDIASFSPNAVLSANTTYKISVKVVFQRLVNAHWVTYTEGNQRVGETQEYSFKTGEAPTAVPITAVDRLYPFIDQRNFYKDEPNKGNLRFEKPFEGFFLNFKKWKVTIETLEGELVNNLYATHDGQQNFNYALPANLKTNTTYNFILKGEELTNIYSKIDTIKPAIKFAFTTSKYGTLGAKINALQMVQPVVGRVASDAIDLQAGVNEYEGFELYELTGNKFTGNKGMIEGEADVTDEPYYNNIIKPLMYADIPLKSADGQTFSIQGAGLLNYGVPPFKAITPSWYYVNALTTASFNTLLRTRMPFIHNTNKYFNLHFADFRIQLIKRYIDVNTSGANGVGGFPPNLPANIKSIIEFGFPFMLKGQYKAKFTFVQLDGTRGTTGSFIYENPIE